MLRTFPRGFRWGVACSGHQTEGGNTRSNTWFARYCGVVTEQLGEGVAWAVTLNEPNLPRLLTWLDLPAAVRQAERATLLAAGRAAGVPRYRVANVVLPEEMDAMADGMVAGHRAARAELARPRI